MHPANTRRATRLMAFIAAACLIVLDPAAAALAVPGLPSTPDGPFAAPLPPACDLTVGPETPILDGEKNASGVGPGTVICLSAGTRGNLKLFNLHGSAADPIVIRNADGTTTITGHEFEAGILIASSTHLRITGTGSASQCGADLESDEQQCGIRVDDTNKGIRVLTSRGLTEELEIDHVAIALTDPDAETRGIAIHPVPGQTISGIRIHHNHVSGSGAEAIYIGSEPRTSDWDALGKVDRVVVADNLVEDIGWDGVKVKVALSESTIQGNVIRRVGLARYEKHQSGITVSTSVVDIHDNRIAHAPEGIKSGRPVDGSTNRFHHNLVIDTINFGIRVEDHAAEVFSNTVVGSEEFGIRAGGAASRIVHNIIADAPEPIAAERDAFVRDNLLGAVGDMGFVNPGRGDFRLSPESPAVGGGQIDRLDLCARTGTRAGRPLRFSVYAGDAGASAHARCRSNLGALPSV